MFVELQPPYLAVYDGVNGTLFADPGDLMTFVEPDDHPSVVVCDSAGTEFRLCEVEGAIATNVGPVPAWIVLTHCQTVVRERLSASASTWLDNRQEPIFRKFWDLIAGSRNPGSI